MINVLLAVYISKMINYICIWKSIFSKFRILQFNFKIKNRKNVKFEFFLKKYIKLNKFKYNFWEQIKF